MKKDEFVNQMKNISPSEHLIKKTISNIVQTKKIEKEKKKSMLKKVIASAIAMITLSVSSVYAYVAISGNTEILEKIGINISKNYENNKQEINNQKIDSYIELADGIKARTVSVSVDNSSLLMEFDLIINDDMELSNPVLEINNIAVFMPNRQVVTSDNLVFSQKSNSAKMSENTWKLFEYVSINDLALAGSSIWSDIFFMDDVVNCQVTFSGLHDGDKLVASFEKENRIFNFELQKPKELNDVNNEIYENMVTYKNITIDGYEVQKSDFGNNISFVAVEKNINIDKVNDIQKIDFIVKDVNGNRLKIISKNVNITISDYHNGKFEQIGLEYQLVVDDVSEDTKYTIEIIETDTVQIPSSNIKNVYDSIMQNHTNGTMVLTPDGYALITSDLNKEDYYVDEYGVYLTYKTYNELILDSRLLYNNM